MNWSWNPLNTYNNYKDRIEKARRAEVVELKNDLFPSAVIKGAGGEKHRCTLDGCDCKGFIIAFKRREPCFHIIRLAMELNILDDQGLTEMESAHYKLGSMESDLSRYFWHYHVLKDALVSNAEYDKLKDEYFSVQGLNRQEASSVVKKAEKPQVPVNRFDYIEIVIPHADYFQINWRVIDINDEYATLWARPFAEMPFYDLEKCHEARYIRTDFSGKNKAMGRLFKVQMSENREDNDQNAAQRYSDIMAYGSNQWAVSTLREYLNGEFLKGLPISFQNAIMPQDHDVLLRKTASSDKSNRRTEDQTYDDSTAVYDRFESDLRSTYSRVTDKIYLPSMDADLTCKTYFSNPEKMVQPEHYWLMDAQTSSDGAPYLTRYVANCRNAKGTLYASVSSCNAKQEQNIWVCPMCVVRASYINSLFE